MSSASWTPVTDGSSASWSKNKALSDLQAAATLYDDATVTYDSISVYYDGYSPVGTTPEGEAGAAWSSATNGSASAWTELAE